MMASSTFDQALANSLALFNISQLKSEQIQCIRSLVISRQDVIAILPTGYGKSVIYQMLPNIIQELEGEMATVIVVSPLDFIRQQQERLWTIVLLMSEYNIARKYA